MLNVGDGKENTADELETVIECAQSFVASGVFASPDDTIYDINPFQVTELLPRVGRYRGDLELSSKKRAAMFDSDCSEAKSQSVFVIPAYFAKHRAPTLRFFSAYCTMPVATSLPEGTIVRSFENQSDDSNRHAPVCRVERIAKHTVTLGCMKQCGVLLSRTDPRWNLHWGARIKDEAEFQKFEAFQRVNHFPGTWVLGRKDALARHVRLAAQKKNKQKFLFAPFTYSWPIDLPLIQRDAKEGHLFIVKPPARARGEGISLFSGNIPQFLQDIAKESREAKKGTPPPSAGQTKAVKSKDEDSDSDEEDDDADDEVMIQRYLSDPLLVNGYKVDLRVYVVCTSFDPLRLYVYNEGLVRFATEPYPSKEDLPASLKNVFCHLTNYSVNKQSSKYKEASCDDDGSGSKWSFHALKRYFTTQGWSWDDAWRDVHDVVIKTFIAVEASVCAKASVMKHRFNCFELYGFDIMLDSNRKAHLIEVNVMPSLACGAALDKHVKGHMIADMLTLVGIPVADKIAISNASDAMREQRRSGIGRGEDVDLLSNNIESKPSKFDPKKWASELDYFGLNATEDDKVVIRDCEEELRRSGGFQRVFPTAASQEAFGELFENPRHYNKLIWTWEKFKAKVSDDQRRELVRWLAGECSFPLTKKKRSQSVRTPDIPRCAQVPVSAKPRVSSSPRNVALKAPVLPPIEKRSVPVCVFSFIPVNKQPN